MRVVVLIPEHEVERALAGAWSRCMVAVKR